MKNNFKELCHLLRVNQNKKFVRLSIFFDSDRGMGTKLSAHLLYFSLLDKSLNKKSGDGDSYWIQRPKRGVTKPEFIKDWVIDIDLEYLFDYSSPTTLKNAFGCLQKSGLLHIDEYNRIHIKYPVDGKLLSPKYAAIAILAKKKKEKLDEDDKNKVKSSQDEKVEDFFDNL